MAHSGPNLRRTRPAGGALAVALAAAVLVAGACTDQPLAPDAPGPELSPVPEFLIGDSPLRVKLVSEDLGNLGTIHYVEIGSVVPRGIARAVSRRIARAGKDYGFAIRSIVEFTIPGGWVSIVDPKVDGLPGVAKKRIRSGKFVAISTRVDIPAAEWTKLVAANAQAKLDGKTMYVNVTLELILTDAAGKEHVLDRASAVSIVDPKVDG